MYVGALSMAKDKFGCKHLPVRHAGYKYSIKAIEDVSFILQYERPEYALFFVGLDVGAKESFVLFGYRLSLCLNCGRFTHFGVEYGVCWVCEDELEDDNFEDE
jgi:hypothetical protein